jgi:DNA-binding MarR family transcriptional regulator
MMREPAGGGRELAELALQLGRAVYGESPRSGITPAQWTALRFFARANRFSRTVSAFAQFHATTRGTASQTIKGLVTRGYLRRTRSERDGRSACFDLTPRSRALLAEDPLEHLVRRATELAPAAREGTVVTLRQLLAGLARERVQALPGRCALCGHLAGGVGTGSRWQCGLMQEPLAEDELQQLCARFSPVG